MFASININTPITVSPVRLRRRFGVESSNAADLELNCDLICMCFPAVIRNYNVLIQHAYSDRWIMRSQHSGLWLERSRCDLKARKYRNNDEYLFCCFAKFKKNESDRSHAGKDNTLYQKC